MPPVRANLLWRSLLAKGNQQLQFRAHEHSTAGGNMWSSQAERLLFGAEPRMRRLQELPQRPTAIHLVDAARCALLFATEHFLGQLLAQEGDQHVLELVSQGARKRGLCRWTERQQHEHVEGEKTEQNLFEAAGGEKRQLEPEEGRMYGDIGGEWRGEDHHFPNAHQGGGHGQWNHLH